MTNPEAEIDPDEVQQRALAEAERAERVDLFTTDSDHVRDAEFGGLEYLDPNPRQVKRFDNAYRLQLHVASTASDLEFRPEELAALAKWVAIGLRWPELAEDLDREPGLLAELEEHVYRGNADPPETDIARRFNRWFRSAELVKVLVDPSMPSVRLADLPPEAVLRVS